MKKIYCACAACLLSLLLVFAGCMPNGSSRVFNYLKDGKEFSEQSSSSGKYRINLTVNDDLSYVLNVYYGTGALQTYKTEGTQMEYLGCYESEFTSEWLGVTQKNVAYSHVVKLPDAEVEMNERNYVFYLVANTTSKRSTSFSLSLVYYVWNSNFDVSGNLQSIVNSSQSFAISKK